MSEDDNEIYPLHGKEGCFVIKVKGKHKVLYPDDMEKIKQQNKVNKTERV